MCRAEEQGVGMDEKRMPLLLHSRRGCADSVSCLPCRSLASVGTLCRCFVVSDVFDGYL